MSTFVNEIIGGDGKRKYKLVAEDGTVLHSGIRIEKDYTPQQEGTHITAEMLNALAEKLQLTTLQQNITDGTIKANADRLQGKPISETAPTVDNPLLVFDGTKYTPAPFSDGFVTGYISGQSSVTINLGFAPKCVFLFADNFDGNKYDTVMAIPNRPQRDIGNSYVNLVCTSTGFEAKYLNTYNCYYRYIAWR